MSKKEINIDFNFSKLKTNQFAIIETFYDSKNNDVEFTSTFEVGAEEQLLEINVKGHFQFMQNEKPFIIIEVSGFFNVYPDSWASFYDKEKKTLTIPKGFIIHLSTLVTGAARGVLHAKTDSTIFNKFVMPTVNLLDMIEDDFVLEAINTTTTQ
jgi:hypothetical protein